MAGNSSQTSQNGITTITFTPEQIDEVTKFISFLFIVEPTDETLKQDVAKIKDPRDLTTLNIIIKMINQFYNNKVKYVEDMVFDRMEKVVKAHKAIVATPAAANEIMSLEQARKRKREELYNIQKPKNFKLDPKSARPSHIHDWESKRRGYSMKITGPDYKSGVVNDILRKAPGDFGIPQAFFEEEKYCFIALDTLVKRQIVIDAIQARIQSTENPLNLEIDIAKYRPPIIKINLDVRDCQQSWDDIIAEIRDWNLKRFTKNTFELNNVYKLRSMPYNTLCIKVDPIIRDYLAEEHEGMIFFRGKRIQVYDYFNVRKCFDCGLCGHLRCKEKQRRCLRCAGPHKRIACQANSPQCPACRGPHEAFHISCTSFQEELQKEMNTIDYVYTTVMWSPFS